MEGWEEWQEITEGKGYLIGKGSRSSLIWELDVEQA